MRTVPTTTTPLPPAARGGTPDASVDLVIECLRGLAALWVFLFHIEDLIRVSIPALYPLASEGHRGVPVFFAISGYCIFAAAQNAMVRGNGARTFLTRRLRRIYPVFWASIVVVMCMPFVLELISSLKSGAYAAPSPAWQAYSATDWFGVVTLSKELIDHATGGDGAYIAINTVYWSLAIEVQFYLVVFLAIVSGRYWKVVLGLVSLLSVFAIASGTFRIPGLFLHLWPGFLCGVLVRMAHTARLTPATVFGARQLPASIALLALVAAACVALAAIGDIGFTASAMLACAVIWCLGGVEHALSQSARIAPRARTIGAALVFPLVLLGQSSYSLYLLHGKVHQLPDMFLRQVLAQTNPLYPVLLVGATCVMCYVFYWVVERRFHNRRLPAPAKDAGAPLPVAGTLAG